MSMADRHPEPAVRRPECEAQRLLPDGRELCVVRRIYNSILTIGPDGEGWFDDSY